MPQVTYLVLQQALARMANPITGFNALLAAACDNQTPQPTPYLIDFTAGSSTFWQSNISVEDWDKSFQVNVRGQFLMVKHMLPKMIAAGWGRMIFVASNAGLSGYGYTSAYCASKHAVVGFMRAIAAEIARTNVTANAVCPGFVETDMWASVAREQGALLNQSPEEFTRRRVHQIPLGRMERPEDVANVIGFLVSPRSDYMTGQALSVDGGLVMHG